MMGYLLNPFGYNSHEISKIGALLNFSSLFGKIAIGFVTNR